MLKNIEKPKLSFLLDSELSNMLYQNDKYNQASEEYLDYSLKYPQDPDILHNLACSLFMQEKYDLALKYFIKSANIIWSYHSAYHFISSALYYNKGDFIKAKFLYRHDYSGEQNPMKNAFIVKETLGNLCIFANNINITIDIIDKSHFKYHCEAANQFFNRGMCFYMLKKYDMALYDFIRATEFDAKNPDNTKINNYITQIRNGLL